MGDEIEIDSKVEGCRNGVIARVATSDVPVAVNASPALQWKLRNTGSRQSQRNAEALSLKLLPARYGITGAATSKINAVARAVGPVCLTIRTA